MRSLTYSLNQIKKVLSCLCPNGIGIDTGVWGHVVDEEKFRSLCSSMGRRWVEVPKLRATSAILLRAAGGSWVRFLGNNCPLEQELKDYVAWTPLAER